MSIKSGGEFEVAHPSGSAFVQFSKLAFGIWATNRDAVQTKSKKKNVLFMFYSDDVN
jgi:hypothetical protein